MDLYINIYDLTPILDLNIENIIKFFKSSKEQDLSKINSII